MNIHYSGTLLAVQDIARAKAFYMELFGLTIVEDYGINIAFDCGLCLQQEFAWLADVPPESVMTQSHNMELYFQVDDFDAWLSLLDKRGDIRYVHPTKTHSWQQRALRIYDPDGHIIEIGEEMDRVVQRLRRQGMTPEEIAAVTQQTLAYVERAIAKA